MSVSGAKAHSHCKNLLCTFDFLNGRFRSILLWISKFQLDQFRGLESVTPDFLPAKTYNLNIIVSERKSTQVLLKTQSGSQNAATLRLLLDSRIIANRRRISRLKLHHMVGKEDHASCKRRKQSLGLVVSEMHRCMRTSWNTSEVPASQSILPLPERASGLQGPAGSR